LVAVAEAGLLWRGQEILTTQTSSNIVQHNRVQEFSNDICGFPGK
jgi:hypothetical protein